MKKYTFTSKFPFIKRTDKQTFFMAEVKLDEKGETYLEKIPTYGEHMRSNPPIPEKERGLTIVPAIQVEAKQNDSPFVPPTGKIGEGEPWFDPRNTLAMNEQCRQYYEQSKGLTAKTEKVLLALKVFGSGCSHFIGKKTGLGEHAAGYTLAGLKKQGRVTSAKTAVHKGRKVESYSLAAQ